MRLLPRSAYHDPVRHSGDLGDQYHPTSHGSPTAILKHQFSTPRLTPKLAPTELPSSFDPLPTHKGSARKSCPNESEITDALFRLLAGGTTGQGAQGQSQGSHSGQGSSSKAGQNQSRLLGGWSNKPKGKGRDGGRKRPGDEQPGGDGSKKQKPDQPDAKCRLACPFYKRDRQRYASCRNAKLRSVADVRQHLLRTPHRRPLHCPTCKRIFAGGNNIKLRDQLAEHIRQRRCTERDIEVPGVTEDQIRQLTSRENRCGTTTDNWFKLWEILFPGFDRPSDPYLTASGLQDNFGDVIEGFWESGPGREIPAESRPEIRRLFKLLTDYAAIFEANSTGAALSTAPDSPAPSTKDPDLPAAATPATVTVAPDAPTTPLTAPPEGEYIWHPGPVNEIPVAEADLQANFFSDFFFQEYLPAEWLSQYLQHEHLTQGDLAQANPAQAHASWEYRTEPHQHPGDPRPADSAQIDPSPVDSAQIDPNPGYPPRAFMLESPPQRASTPPPAPERQHKRHQSDENE